MENERKDIRVLVEKHSKLQTLMNYVNLETLKEEHRKQLKNKAVGIDGKTKEEYGVNLTNNLKGLLERMKKMSYRPLPVRRTYIPKSNGLRPLGIPSYEDKLVQGCMANVLKQIYEPKFLECSYGFREKRSAHMAIKQINYLIGKGKSNYVLDCDIRGYFDNVNQEWLMKFLRNDIEDERFLRYVMRFLKAGIMEDNKLFSSDVGTPQGGLISPILANIYLHYALDLWFERIVKPRIRGEAHLVRYADDFLITFQYESDSKLVYEALIKRLAKFGLQLAEEKTRIIAFGRFAETKETFDFLGFTHYGGKSRKGNYMLKHRISRKKLKEKKAKIRAWILENVRQKVSVFLTKLNVKLTGTYRYYGINGMSEELHKLNWYVQRTCLIRLNRRSQRQSYTIESFVKVWNTYVTGPRIYVNIWNN